MSAAVQPATGRAASLWTVSTGNEKTGAIPTQYVGATYWETVWSCLGCSLLPPRLGRGTERGGCYAHGGNSRRGCGSVQRAAAAGRPTDLATVLERTPRGARCGRLGAIGDPARVERRQLYTDVELLRRESLRVLGYTHHWRSEPWNGRLRGVVLASCETPEQADEASDRGWLVALAGPDKAEGYITCPHALDASVQCNRCGLCDVPTLARTRKRGIVFPAHGGAARRLPLAGVTL